MREENSHNEIYLALPWRIDKKEIKKSGVI